MDNSDGADNQVTDLQQEFDQDGNDNIINNKDSNEVNQLVIDSNQDQSADNNVNENQNIDNSENNDNSNNNDNNNNVVKSNITTDNQFSNNYNIQEKIKYWENKCKKDKENQKKIEVPEIFDPFCPIKHSQNINIEVLNPVQKSSGMSKYTTYQIITKEEGQECQIYRRYNEFQALRQALVNQFPGIYIPNIPDKQSINVSDYQMIKFRTRVFNGFLKQISLLPHLFKSEPVQIFLKSPENDCRKQLESLKINVIATIEKLGEHFSHLQGKELSLDLVSQINNMVKNLNISIPKLKDLITFMTAMANTKDKNDQNLSSLFEFCLNDYEKLNFSEYIGKDDRKLLLANKELKEFNKIKENVMKQAAYNPYRQILECMQSELLIEEAMLDAINQRNQLEKNKNAMQQQEQKLTEELNKIEQNKKSSISGIFSKKSPEEKAQSLKGQIEQLQQDKQNLEKLFDIQTAIFTFIEIDNFRKRKQYIYQKMTQLVSSTEINKSVEQIQFWQLFGDLAKEFSTVKDEDEENE